MRVHVLLFTLTLTLLLAPSATALECSQTEQQSSFRVSVQALWEFIIDGVRDLFADGEGRDKASVMIDPGGVATPVDDPDEAGTPTDDSGGPNGS